MKAMLVSRMAVVVGLAAPCAAWSQEGPIPLLPAPAPAASVATASVGSLRTTTDSLEYCTELLGRVDTMTRETKSPTAERARSLSQEGERLCKHGQARSGILHLRRAFILIHPPEGGH